MILIGNEEGLLVEGRNCLLMLLESLLKLIPNFTKKKGKRKKKSTKQKKKNLEGLHKLLQEKFQKLGAEFITLLDQCRHHVDHVRVDFGGLRGAVRRRGRDLRRRRRVIFTSR